MNGSTPGKSRDSETAASARSKPAETMLRDEATTWLFERLQDEPSSVLRVEVEDGMFRAEYVRGVTTFEGDWLPNLTDALCSLIGCLP